MSKQTIKTATQFKRITIETVKQFELSFRKIDELWAEDLETAEKNCEKRNETQYNNSMEEYRKNKEDKDGAYIPKPPKRKCPDQKEIDEFAIKHGKLSEYLKRSIIPSRDGGYWVIENGSVVLKSKEAFNKIEKKLNAKSKGIMKSVIDDCVELYTPDVYTDDYLIDHENFRINLSKRFNFTYKKNFYAGNKESQREAIKNSKTIIAFMKEVITSNIEEEWSCLSYIISCMSKRKQSQIVTFLTGLGGIGKTFFTDILRMLFGSSFASTSEATLTGENQFNMMIVGAVSACLEETSGRENYQKMMSKIKEFATSKQLTARKMYVEGFQVANMLNIFVLSNHFRDIDCAERRVFCPTLNNKYQNDHKYFEELSECLTEDALQLVYNFFLKVILKNLLKSPIT